ncbi:MAG: nickel pincer cofactor biosynthesis protein LarC [Chloroflexota bacterium]
MKIAYFDCIAGASGDMILGALVDTGVPFATLQARLAALKLDEFELKAEKVVKNGFSATKVDVIVHEHHHHGTAHHHGRHLSDIEALIRQSALDASIQERAMDMFRRLAEAEAGIHNAPVEKVHLHEVGGVDTIVDVTGALIGLAELGVEQVHVSPLPLGRGFVHGAHGQIPLPAPATVALLKGVPVTGSEIEKELVTPTGAVILSTLAAGFGPIPAMHLEAVGYGAGGRDLPIPNVIRLLLGETGKAATLERLALLETNVDDSNPEIFGYLMEKLLAAGALDVFFTPIQMKKNRPATLLSALCRPPDVDRLEAILLNETSTLGIRRQWVERRCLERSSETVQTRYGPVRIKIARLPGGTTKSAPEYDDCRNAAEAHQVPLRDVYAAALAGYSNFKSETR